MADGGEIARCPWTGAAIATAAGPHRKKFASNAARNQAHTAARLYTEQLIAAGFLSWEQVRAWWDGRKQGGGQPCTAAGEQNQGEAQP